MCLCSCRYEPHLWDNERRFYQRSAVLFGALIQLNRLYTDTGQRLPSPSDTNVLNMSATVPRFTYLPIRYSKFFPSCNGRSCLDLICWLLIYLCTASQCPKLTPEWIVNSPSFEEKRRSWMEIHCKWRGRVKVHIRGHSILSVHSQAFVEVDHGPGPPLTFRVLFTLPPSPYGMCCIGTSYSELPWNFFTFFLRHCSAKTFSLRNYVEHQVGSKFGEGTLKLGSMLSDGQVGRLKDKSALAISTFGDMYAAGLFSSLTASATKSDG